MTLSSSSRRFAFRAVTMDKRRSSEASVIFDSKVVFVKLLLSVSVSNDVANGDTSRRVWFVVRQNLGFIRPGREGEGKKRLGF